MFRILCAAALIALAVPATAADSLLVATVNAKTRAPENVVRDKYRHPLESLTFWGVAPGQTVIEVAPGGGYWTEILATYLKGNGHYIAATGRADSRLPAKFANTEVYGAIDYSVFSNSSGPLAPPGSADLVLTARNIHDWLWTAGESEKFMRDAFAALKPGGILAVEDHRADPRPQIGDARDGYVATATIVKLATDAGFRLEAKSEINANPRDTKNHPFGVWTLPPSRQSAPNGQPDNPNFDHGKYDAIGESDRMTLRFRKP